MWKRLVVTAALGLVACGPGQLTPAARNDGALTVTVGVSRSSLHLADSITRVELSLTNGAFTATLHLGSATAGQWTGTLDPVPVGSGYTLAVEAYDAGDTLLYQGSMSPITVTPNTMSTVIILAQQASPPAPYVNVPPHITGVPYDW